MRLGEDLVKLSAKDDPVAEAAKKGKAPSIRDVKKSVKVCSLRSSFHEIRQVTTLFQALLKRLIHATTQMDVLPSTSI